MSEKPKRRYRDYSWVALQSPIRCPKRNTSQADFDGKQFAFFVEDGMFCIEVRGKPDLVTDVSPAQIREARRKTDAELAADRLQLEGLGAS